MTETPAFSAVKVFVPTGQLGSSGVRPEEIEAAIALGMDVMAMDAGSTDSGAAYLATGKSKNNRSMVKKDLLLLMEAQKRTGAPILIGTAGQAGGDINVDWTVDVVREVAREQGYAPKIAVLKSEQSKETIKAKNAAGRIRPLPPLGPLADETIDECEHIVALMGPEPFIAALEQGADIIVGGRSTDSAVLAAYPLWKGAPVGPSWHAGKTAECGALCSVKMAPANGCFLTIHADGFDVQPLVQANKCTPQSVSAHMLYENSNPFRLTEPGGVLDVTNCDYRDVDGRQVRVTGSVWEPKPYTMKLEGAAGGRYQTIMLIGIADPLVLENLDLFHDKMHSVLVSRVKNALGDSAGDFDISLRIYGWNAVSGRAVPEGTPPPPEVGVLCVITAHDQELANQIARAANAAFFHMPLFDGMETPSYGFPFTPSSSERGQAYEFKLNHVVEVGDPLELVRTEWIDLSATIAKDVVHA
ncbi:acyclic terpene utilization AtuA family protein [Sphingomonas oligophenolica]|uniref:Acyclic terpene utilization AtuA family protein n=1 Tax=Sphingomonas oligophenolica TaxID=301154 RepID=A0ABU9Y670_9SPHN